MIFDLLICFEEKVASHIFFVLSNYLITGQVIFTYLFMYEFVFLYGRLEKHFGPVMQEEKDPN